MAAGEYVLAILAAYGGGIGLVHLLQSRSPRGRRKAHHAVVVTRNAALTIEWHLRTLAFKQWLRAQPENITIVDEGSTDETLPIVRRLAASRRADWRVISAASETEALQWFDRLDRVDEFIVVRGGTVAERIRAAARP